MIKGLYLKIAFVCHISETQGICLKIIFYIFWDFRVLLSCIANDYVLSCGRENENSLSRIWENARPAFY